jgi:hypothetical protein
MNSHDQTVSQVASGAVAHRRDSLSQRRLQRFDLRDMERFDLRENY